MNKLSYLDSRYPKPLLQVSNPPEELFYKGNIDLLNSNCIAVVGSRNISKYGEALIEKLIPPLVLNGFTIVSGFMYGVDSYAHQKALLCMGNTIAVLPCGINNIIPSGQTYLYEDICHKGLVISEFSNNLIVQKWHFPNRNRIIAGICHSMLVIEAGQNSGSYKSAQLSLKMGKKVYCPTGRITDTMSIGIIDIIKLGGIPIKSAEDLLHTHLLKTDTKNLTRIKFENTQEKNIFNCLSKSPKSVQQLCENLDFRVNEILSTLTKLQMRKLIFEKGGDFYVY